MKGSSKSTTLPKEIPYTRYANFIFVYFKTQSKKVKFTTNQNVLVGIRVKSRAAKPPNEQGVSPNASSHIYIVYIVCMCLKLISFSSFGMQLFSSWIVELLSMLLMQDEMSIRV